MNKNEDTIFEKYNLTTPALIEAHGDANEDIINGDFLKLITMANALNLGLKPVFSDDNRKVMFSNGKTAVFVDDGVYPESLFIHDSQTLKYAYKTVEEKRSGNTNGYLQRLSYDEASKTKAQFAVASVYPYELPIENLKRYLNKFDKNQRLMYIDQITRNYGETIDNLTSSPWARDAKYNSNLATDLATFAEEVAKLAKEQDREKDNNQFEMERE